MSANRDWMNLAACRSEDPEIFFTSTSGPAAHREAARAYAVCARCPVAKRCEEYGRNDQYGVFGGKLRVRKEAPYRSQATAPGRRRTA